MVYTGTSAFTASIAAPPAVRASVLFRRQATSAAPIGLGFRNVQKRQSIQTVVRAATETEAKPEVAKVADSIGLPVDEGLFGFKPFPELWVGRLAMAGFLTSVIEEFITGKGTLQQIGLFTPNPALFGFLLFFFGGLTAYATARTIYRATNKEMTANELVRYRQFLGIQKEQQNIKEEQAKLKKSFAAGKDIVSPDNLNTINQTKAEGSPADRVLNPGPKEVAQQAINKLGGPPDFLGGDAEGDAAVESARMKERGRSGPPAPSVSLASKQDVLEQSAMAGDNDWGYARQVELTNGRWAMLGFLTAIIIEAGTGRGVLLQLVGYAKALNLLGPASGVNL